MSSLRRLSLSVVSTLSMSKALDSRRAGADLDGDIRLQLRLMKTRGRKTARKSVIYHEGEM